MGVVAKKPTPLSQFLGEGWGEAYLAQIFLE